MTRLPRLALPVALAALAACTTEVRCPAGQVACGAQCVSLQDDVQNCGACGLTCGPGAVCGQGACQCGPGTERCGGACVALASDAAHCGACGAACPAPQVCSTSGGATACAAACAPGLTPCDRGCVDLAADRYHCGACGTICAAGAGCVEGACRSVQVACFATDEVLTVAPDFLTAGSPRAAGDGPVALAQLGADAWSAASLSGSLSRLPLDPALPEVELLLGGSDFEYLVAHSGLLFVANAGAASLVVVDPAAGKVVDEIPLVDDQSPANPRGVAFAGGKAYVSLYGIDAQSGQAIAVLDASGLAACRTRAPSDPHCLPRLGAIDVRAGADAPGQPFPGRSVAVGSKVLVVLANLKPGTSGFYTDPAGPGRLAVVESADDSVTFLSLGDGCQNPGGVAVDGGTAWVACGAFGASGLVPVDVAGAPVVGPVLPLDLQAPGNVAFCGSMGFVTDQFSGAVQRFDTGLAAVSGPPRDVCPLGPGPFGFAWAADVLCATAP
jgi:hypothetical protein